MKVLELFSGTHSIGNVCHELGWEVVSLDRDLGDTSPFHNYKSDYHIKEDIMTWDYKKNFKKGEFNIITASPVCLWWSRLRDTWIGRKLKCHGGKITTKELLQEDINKYGKPMVDKVFEIIEYFEPQYWWIENPQTGKMKFYIEEKYPQYNTYYIVDYCKYSKWGYQKKTRIWTNIKNFTPLICKKDCDNIVTIPTKDKKMHKDRMGTSKTVMDNGVMVRVNTKALREKYKDYDNIQQVKKQHKVVLANGYEMINGVKTLCNTKELREKYKDYKNLQNKKLKDIGEIGGVSNKLERYRIPKRLIEELLLCII